MEINPTYVGMNRTKLDALLEAQKLTPRMWG